MRKIEYIVLDQDPDEKIYPHPQPIEVGIGFTVYDGNKLLVEYFDGCGARFAEWTIDGAAILYVSDSDPTYRVVCGKVYYEETRNDE